jgi:hypothetical protein
VAKHYGVRITACPPRRGNRKGVVEKANHSAAQRWWRTLPDDITVAAAQARLDAWCTETGDARTRHDPASGATTVAELAAAERLTVPPLAPFPLVVTVERTVSAQALVSFRGNRYSVPPEHARTAVRVEHRLGSPVVTILTPRGVVIAVHHRVADGTNATLRIDSHVTALNTAAMAAVTPGRPHRRKQRIPPGPAATAVAAELRGDTTTGRDVVIDLSVYAAAAAARRTLA